MTIELSQTTKILILVALAIVAAGAGLLPTRTGTSGSKSVTTDPGELEPLARAGAVSMPHATPVHARDASPRRSLPACPHRFAPHSCTASWSSRSSTRRAIRSTPRCSRRFAQGAKQQHVKVVALDVRNDAVAAATANLMKNPSSRPSSSTKRPGTVVVELDGYTDSGAVAQAIADARR